MQCAGVLQCYTVSSGVLMYAVAVLQKLSGIGYLRPEVRCTAHYKDANIATI